MKKIKLSGAEKRAFARWGNLYAKRAELTYNPSMFIKINSVITLAITLIGTIVMYYMAIKSRVSVNDYFAFNTSYGMISDRIGKRCGSKCAKKCINSVA